MSDVFLNIDEQPKDSVSMISERLEDRSFKGQFSDFTKEYFELLDYDENSRILELGGGTGVIGRNFIEYRNFKGKYVVSDLSKELLNFGEKKAKELELDNHLEFKQIDAMSEIINDQGFYDAIIMHTLVSHVPNPAVVIENAKKLLKRNGKIIIFDADYETLLMASGNKELDEIVNAAIKKGCVAQPKVMRLIPKIANSLKLKLIKYKSNLLFEAGSAEFFYGMGKTLSNAVVKSNQLDKKIADEWLKEIEKAMSENTFFGMCPYITYIYEI